MKNSIKAAVIQMTSGDCPTENALQAKRIIDSAIELHQADLFILPENCFYFGAKPTSSICQIISNVVNEFQVFVKARGINLVLGSIPILNDKSQKFYSRSVYLDANGRSSAEYEKIHLFDVDVGDAHGTYRESDSYERGASLVAAELKGSPFCLGMSICFDLRFPLLYRQLRSRGANVMSVPAAFTAVTGKAHWETLLKARAIETQSYVLAANQVGDHGQGRETWGHSMIVSPWGEVLDEIQQGEGYAVAELDYQFLESIRKKMPLRDVAFTDHD